MAYGKTIIGLNDKAAKEKAAMINERRSQAQKWLRRQSEQKKQSIVKRAPQCQS